MRSSTANLIFGSVLFLSLAGKAIGQRQTAPPDERLFLQTAAMAMRAGGLQLSMKEQGLATALYGSHGRCVLMVFDTVQGNSYEDAYRQFAVPVGRLAYLYRGRWSTELPGRRGLAAEYIRRGLEKLGISTRRFPVVGAAASPGCTFPGVDWSRLNSLPR